MTEFVGGPFGAMPRVEAPHWVVIAKMGVFVLSQMTTAPLGVAHQIRAPNGDPVLGKGEVMARLEVA